MELHPDFRDLLAEFAAENVRFLVIGGYAVGHYDRPRYTKDIDLWIGSRSENLAAVGRALESFGAPAHVVSALANARDDEIVWLGNPPLRIDFLRTIPGVEFADAWPRRVVVSWGGQEVPVIGLDDLILAKRAAGREQDLLDAKNLDRIKGSEHHQK
jgi:predicted nucleotidyltransferase